MNNLNKFGSVVFVESYIYQKIRSLFIFCYIILTNTFYDVFYLFKKFACWFSHEKLIKLAKIKVKIYLIQGIDYSQRISR